MIQLQPRDLELFRFLHHYEIQSSEELGENFFPKIAKTTVLRRLRKLEAEKLIQRQVQKVEGHELWSLTTEGAERIGKKSLPPLSSAPELYTTWTLTKVRKALESQGLGENWSTVMELRANARREGVLPDALFMARRMSNPVTVALHLIGAGGSFRRLRKLLTHYSKMNSIHYLWFIVESEPIAQVLFTVWSTIYKPVEAPLFLITRLGPFLHDPSRLRLWCDPKRYYSAAELFDLKPIPNAPPTTEITSAEERK